MKKMVDCPSCGAEFDAKLVRCPYCGTAYEPAAEDEYMDKLEDIRVELGEHRSDTDKSTGKALLRVVIIFAVAVAVIIIIGMCFFILPEKRRRERQQERQEEFLQKVLDSEDGKEDADIEEAE